MIKIDPNRGIHGGDTEKISSFTAMHLYAFLNCSGDDVESYEVKSKTSPVAASTVIQNSNITYSLLAFPASFIT